MIILFRAYGNHSNRLFQSLHFEAYCIEHGVEYLNPTFSDIEKYYVDPVGTNGSAVSKILGALPLSLVRLLAWGGGVAIFDGGKGKALDDARLNSGRSCHVAGWGFRVHDLTTKHQDVLRARYALKADYYRDNELHRYMREVDRSVHVLVGIHVRRGDYKTYADGEYYFADEVYGHYMEMVAGEIRRQLGKRALFIIFSNEEIGFKEGDQVRIARNPWYVDHHLMSECDYLLGPPSTFTLWASYIGRVKYFHIKNKTCQVRLDDFECCGG